MGTSAPDAAVGVEVDNVGAAEAAKYERIAASLIARANDMPDGEDDGWACRGGLASARRTHFLSGGGVGGTHATIARVPPTMRWGGA